MARACAPTLSTPPGRHRTAPGRATSAVRTSHWCLIIVIVWFSATTLPFLFILFNPSYVSCLSHVVLLILRYCLSGLSCWFSGTVSLACPVDFQLLALYPVLTVSYCLFALSCWLSVTVSLSCRVDSQLLSFCSVLLTLSYCLFILSCWLSVTVFLSCPSCPVDFQLLSLVFLLSSVSVSIVSALLCWFSGTVSLSCPVDSLLLSLYPVLLISICSLSVLISVSPRPVDAILLLSVKLADSQVLCVYILLIPGHCFSILLIGTLCPHPAD